MPNECLLHDPTFIEVPLFTKRWAEIGLTDADLLKLQIMLLKDPESGPIIEGSGGIRKVRFPLENRGKSGSVRVCYTDFSEFEKKAVPQAFSMPAGLPHKRSVSAYSSFLTHSFTSSMLSVGSKRATTLPSRSIRNLVKFHLMSLLDS